MELLQLQYFQVIARTQNISAATEQLHISQPSLSQILKRLEQEAGIPLFDRICRCGVASKTVSLSILSASMLLPDLYQKIKNADPSILLHIRQPNQEHLPAADEFVISSDWKLPADTAACHVLLEEEIQLALPCGNPLLAKPSVCLDDLNDKSSISLSPDSSLIHTLFHYFTVRYFRPDITTYIDNPDIMQKLLAAQIGLSLRHDDPCIRTCHFFNLFR